jgi:superfamily II DNA or RNA helicase
VDGLDAVEPQLQSKILTRAKTAEQFAVYKAALEWSLIDPIVIEGRDDFKSEYRWKGRLEPFHHQVRNLITFCRRLPVTLLADDVGLGKTISAGLIASELMARNRVQKMLIVAPKLLGPQWKSELETKFDISAKFVTGSGLVSADPTETGAIITTYHSAREHLEKIPHDRFDMLVLDEAHKLRNLYGVDPTPKVAKVFRRALEKRRFRFVLMLTATPIQNRLWDLYSLVDLLTVARGHQNPFGSEGTFARRFIGDNRETARVLKADAREEFRKIVYGYMSRVRRGDSHLDFPERKILPHKVTPTSAELALIETIAEPIQKLNRLAQISILKALTSSPHALMAQLNNMAANRTIPIELAAAVREIVTPMKTSAKLEGLGQLVDQLRKQNPSGWRMVVFTQLRETQTTIEAHLSSLGLKVGIINGSSGQRNQDTIARFHADPPDTRVIVSTEAGSEGVNLQIANVLINYDLPWNPMIVEQRIGRVQRLGSPHKNVIIYNVMLADTFEEFIVGRLMSKLQMASDAIGDVESLLEATGVGQDGEEGGDFDEKIRELVLQALAGKDMTAAAEKVERSIDEAKRTLEQEKHNIDATLGAMDGYEYVGPKTPNLGEPKHSMEFEPFVRSAYAMIGGEVTEIAPGVLQVITSEGKQYARLRDDVPTKYAHAPYLAPGSPAFLRLVDRVTSSGLHNVDDLDEETLQPVDEIVRAWVETFKGKLLKSVLREVRPHFAGSASVRARAVMAHDSFERIVDVPCTDHIGGEPGTQIERVPDLIRNPLITGLDLGAVARSALKDADLQEFTRFYLERRAQEIASAGADERKRNKLEDEFTPRIDLSLVGLQGTVQRHVTTRAKYFLDEHEFESDICTIPSGRKIVSAPMLVTCDLTGKVAPIDCFGKCSVSEKRILRHRLVRSDISGRMASPEFVSRCSVSGKMLLPEEAAVSDVTGAVVGKTLLKTCAVSGRKAEPAHFGYCDFSSADVLLENLATSVPSGRKYRSDQGLSSVVSGRSGHKSEFVICYETRQPILPDEAERCSSTGKLVRIGVLEACGATGRRVLRSELEPSTVSGKKVLRDLLVQSSLSAARFIESEGIRSAYGNFCAPVEARPCQWSGEPTHPDDLRTCSLLGLSVHLQFLTHDTNRLEVMQGLLSGSIHTTDYYQRWDDMAVPIARVLKNQKCKIEAARLSPDGRRLALCGEVKSMLGLRTRTAGMLVSLEGMAVVGQVALVKRDTKSGGFRVE